MPLPKTANVEAAPGFLRHLAAAHEFFLEQDQATAEARMRALKAALLQMEELLGWSPACGRPARFLASKSVQALLQRDSVQRKASQLGLSSLREMVVEGFVVLYAHSTTEVLLLALRHQRQLAYRQLQ